MSLGKEGEEFAAKFLLKKGYKILGLNYHWRFGEIDIIAKDKNTFVFVEVKSRTNTLFGQPGEAITPKKLSKMIKTAQFYLAEYKLENKPFRFDAIEVFINGSFSANHIQNITL